MNNGFDGSSLYQELPSSLISIFKALDSHGFYFILIGGGMRDYLLFKQVPKDLDFEIRHRDTLAHNEWEKKLESAIQLIQSQFKVSVEELAYSVFRFKVEDFDIELSSPRIEHFQAGVFGHSNFSAELFSNLAFDQAFSRRDFTINAIGGEISCSDTTVILRDPFNGVFDLARGELRHCGDHFFLDPVRLLRGLRFSLRFNMQFSSDTEALFSQFNLSELSRYYLLHESLKSNFAPFMRLFFKTVEEFEIAIPAWCRALSFLGSINSEIKICSSSDIVFYSMMNGLTEDTSVLKAFIPLKDSYYNSLLELKKRAEDFDFHWIKDHCTVSDLEAPAFESFFKFYQLLSRMKEINLNLLEGESRFIIAKVQELTTFQDQIAIDVTIPKKILGKYLLYKRMESAWRS